MTLVVKLGSSIVAADDGELREDVLDSVCAQVAALEQAGARVAMVTSGAIARGIRLMSLPERPRAMDELQAASDAGIDALVAVYHSDHCELCAHERDWPFRIINVLEVVGASMGLHRDDRYKELKLMQDADQIVAECKDLIVQHSLDVTTARNVIAKGMLGDQPLPLK